MDSVLLPAHIAIIMDGNRRWAKREGKDTPSGHREGAENLKRIARYANEIGIKYMTVYAFSTENWKRSEVEVSALMKILKFFINDFIKNSKSNIKIKVIGKRDNLSEDLKTAINSIEDKSKNNDGMVLNIAFNYGGREEIVATTKKIAKAVQEGNVHINDIDEVFFANNIYTNSQPDPDLLIRTSGEERISNFLLWQIAYSEFYFTNKYWPEFSSKDLDEAIEAYTKRNRKFGGK